MDPEHAPAEMAGLLEALQGLDSMASAGGAQMAGGAVAPAGGEGEEITPEPAFVVKTKDDTGRKVFINVLGSPAIGAPGGWEGGRVPDHVEEALRRQEAAPDESLRFPLSLSEPRNDLDRKGEPCTVFDCAFNADVVKQATAHRRLQVFLVELAMGWTSSKHDLILDPKFKLPRLRYKGDQVQTHTIRKDPKRVVQEVQEVEEEPTFPRVTKKLPATAKNLPKGARGAAGGGGGGGRAARRGGGRRVRGPARGAGAGGALLGRRGLPGGPRGAARGHPGGGGRGDPGGARQGVPGRGRAPALCRGRRIRRVRASPGRPRAGRDAAVPVPRLGRPGDAGGRAPPLRDPGLHQPGLPGARVRLGPPLAARGPAPRSSKPATKNKKTATERPTTAKAEAKALRCPPPSS